jgi:uracil-DNA glycosylase family 4
MTEYQSLTDWGKEQEVLLKEKKIVQKKEKVPGVVKNTKKRGCEFCPLNKVPGIHKVKNLDKITGKKIMIWAQNPGEKENKERLELVGPSGSLFWLEAERVGLKREHCDVQNVVRCWTVSRNELFQLVPREPSKEEIHCCSLYTEEAIERNHGKAKVHLVLGRVAAKTLLKGEFRKDQKTFYSKRLDAWVVCTYHPSYFLRGGGTKSRKAEFRDALDVVVKKAGQGKGRFAYVEAQDYKAVLSTNLKKELIDPIREASKKGERIVVDIEDDWNGKKNVIVYIGFGWKRGYSRGVFLQHPEVKQSKSQLQKKLAAVKEILEDETIKKAFQHGSYDVDKIKDLLEIRTKGYDHDTQYSEYLRFSGRKAFGLEAIADVRFREFAGYKGILDPYRDEKTKMASFLKVPAKIVVRYNGADCDLTKRIEKDNADKIDKELMQVFIWVAFPLGRMEGNGPLFDSKHDEILQKWIPARLEKLREQLKEITGNPKFNPNSPIQIAEVVYDKLKLGKYLDPWWRKENGQRTTKKDAMQMLAHHHKFPGITNEFRKLAKKESTYMKGFRLSATLHGGRLRTSWWLTGTITGRLRSGGSRDKSKGIVNLQNIHGDPAIENLLVSDLRWRELYKAWEKKVV